MRIIVIWLVTAVAVWAAVSMVPGVDISGDNALVELAVIAAVLALLNAVLKPILKIVTFPLLLLTLGLFSLILNTLMLYAASGISGALFDTHLEIDSFGSAFLAALIISIVTVILGGITGANDKQKWQRR